MRFRYHKKRNLLNKRSFFIVVFLIGLSCGTYVFAFSDLFVIKNLEISGNENLTKEEIKAKMDMNMELRQEYGLSGKNFFLVEPEELANQLKNDFPEIKEVRVEKVLPDKLTVKIEEEDPALIWCRQKCFLINAEGTVFMDADETALVEESKYFIKIIETEYETMREKEEESKDIDKESPLLEKNTSLDIEKTDKESEQKAPGEKSNKEEIKNEINEIISDEYKEDLKINDKVSDNNFIDFLLDINNKISYNSQLKIKYYQTKGTASRELVAVTDKNIKVYFDTTKDAAKQAKNLGYFLSDGIGKDSIDSLEYIYLKTEDRVFYK
ncbi:MAG: FtsQ-type POTRA domain-containing protein [Candidatus Pacebacteria bacterium]|nr:FtsQ-type POTRA domain-containing protein [Candidatus Paceibacterota bacterium]